MAKRPNPQPEADRFNATFNVGDEVDYAEVVGLTPPKRYRTRSPAQVLSGHTAVVWLVGRSGCVACSHCAKPTAGR